MSTLALALTVFLACAVEAVEALTVILAVGTTREWRSALQGAATALLVLTAVVAALGPAVALIPLAALRVLVGAVLLLFGLQWLRKAVLRAAGRKALRDEAAAFAREVAAAERAAAGGRGMVGDWYAFVLSFKGVLLEGLEVAFIVVSFGGSHHDLPVASVAALAAVVVVAGVGAAVRAPLARVPENTMKFAVGTMLTAFGTFWAAEGAGAAWPGSDAALLVLVPGVALVALGYAALLRRGTSARGAGIPAGPAVAEPVPAGRPAARSGSPAEGSGLPGSSPGPAGPAAETGEGA